MPDPLWVVWAIIGLALIFDYINGFHDAANSIATVVSTRVLSPKWAVIWAAFFNFIAFLVFDLKVAGTIGKGIVIPEAITLQVVAAGLMGAIVWNLITWYYGIPSSSSHALVGGFAGAAFVSFGWKALILNFQMKGLLMICAFIVIAPMLGMILGWIFMVATYWIFRYMAPARVSGLFRKLQLLSAAGYSLAHGGNDAQKTMGIIMATLVAAKQLGPKAEIPLWVVLSCHTAMGLGTLGGGWRIVKTMGQKICKLHRWGRCRILWRGRSGRRTRT